LPKQPIFPQEKKGVPGEEEVVEEEVEVVYVERKKKN